MFVGDLFEKAKKDNDTPKGFVGNKSQIAGVKRALDRAYQENPSARNDFEAMAGHIDKVDSLNAQQSRMLKQQERENATQTQQIQKLSKDIQDKEQRFRDLNAQIAKMPDATPQQVAQMTQDLEKAHDDETPGEVDVKDIVTKHATNAKEKAKVSAAPQKPAVNISVPAKTKQSAPSTQTPATDAGSRAFGAMAGQLATPTQTTYYPAKSTPGDALKKSAAQAQQPPSNTATQPGDEFEPISQDELDQLLSTHDKERAVAEADYQPGNPNIGGLNWTSMMQSWKAGQESIDWKFPDGNNIRLYRPQMFAILQVVAGVVKKLGPAAKEQIIQDVFSDSYATRDWLQQPAPQRYVELFPDWLAKQQAQVADPNSPQGSLIGPGGEPTAAAVKQTEPQQGELFREGRFKQLDIDRQEQGIAPVQVFKVVRKKDGQNQVLKQHNSIESATRHAQNIKQKYPGMEVGVLMPTGQVTMSGLKESQDSSDAVYGAIIRRIIGAHASLISSFGIEAVMSVAQDVADWNSDVEEIGTSDVSGWVREVFRKLQEEK